MKITSIIIATPSNLVHITDCPGEALYVGDLRMTHDVRLTNEESKIQRG